MLNKIKQLRSLFISNIDNFQAKYNKLTDESKRERQVLLDIVKMEQKHNTQLRVQDPQKVTFNEEEKSAFNEPSKAEEELVENSSLSIGYESYDENYIKYDYEINIKNKAIEVFQEKLISLTAQLQIEKQQYDELQEKFDSILKSKGELFDENKLLK